VRARLRSRDVVLGALAVALLGLVPAAPMAWTPVLWVALIAVALATLGIANLSKHDIG
jgi:putative exporter of polyketide antibiotics